VAPEQESDGRDLIWLRQSMERPRPKVTQALNKRVTAALAWTRDRRLPPTLTVWCGCRGKLLMAWKTPGGVLVKFNVRASDIDGVFELNGRCLPAAAVPPGTFADWADRRRRLERAKALLESPFYREDLVLACDVLPWPSTVTQPATILARCKTGEHHLPVPTVLDDGAREGRHKRHPKRRRGGTFVQVITGQLHDLFVEHTPLARTTAS